jgi:hypothetical protein
MSVSEAVASAEGMRHVAEENLPDAGQIIVTDPSAISPPLGASDRPRDVYALEVCEQ